MKRNSYTSSSEKTNWWNMYVGPALVFIVISLIITAFPFLIFKITEEDYDADNVISRQISTDETVIFGPAYSNVQRYYKLNSAIQNKADVLAIGTSRIMQLREELFDNATFYNTGGGITAIDHLVPLLEHIPKESQPKIIIVALDQYFFNPYWSRSDDVEKQFMDKGNPFKRILDKYTKIYNDYFKDRKYSIMSVLSKKNKNLIGLNAVINGNGFRNDGSYYYSKEIAHDGVLGSESEDHNFSTSFWEMEMGINRFTYSDRISKKALNHLDEFLNVSTSRGIYVIGFMPPYPHTIWENMMSMGKKYSYIPHLNEYLSPIFEKYDLDYYDFSDMAEFNASDCESIDGTHGSEKTFVRLYIKMAENNEALMFISDTGRLKNELADSSNCFEVFD